jgi:hypothetical protein
MPHIYLESHGVRLDVEVQDDALLDRVLPMLPPGWEPLSEFPEDGHLTIAHGADGLLDVIVDGDLVATSLTPDLAVHVLDSQLRARVARLAKDRVFIHAGAVAMDGRALVLPAPSFAGKSSLVAALIGAGADYLSDEFAVLDAKGLVHPYPRALSLREVGDRYGARAMPDDLGARVPAGPVPVAMIAITNYAADARWDPRPLEPGRGALALLANAVPARSRTEETLEAVSAATKDARILEGARGDAEETARLMLEELANVGDLQRG